MTPVNPVLAANAPLLHAATRAWQRLPVVADEHDSATGALNIQPPGDRDLAEDAEPGDLVLIPNFGLWRVALVIDTDHTHETHVQVACVGHAQPTAHLTLEGTYPPEPAVFFVQRNNCYRTQLRAAQVHTAQRQALPGTNEGSDGRP